MNNELPSDHLMNTTTTSRRSGSDDGNGNNTTGSELREGAVNQFNGSGGPVRRPRGRPPGSKNRPKGLTYVTHDDPYSLRTHIMEVATGADVVDCLATYSRRCRCDVVIFSATGSISRVKIRQYGGAFMELKGTHEIITLTGAFPSGPGPSGLTVNVSDGQGRILGGKVVGPLFAVGPVTLIAGTFAASFRVRLPLPSEEEDTNDQDEAKNTSHSNGNTNNNDSGLGYDVCPMLRVGLGQSPGPQQAGTGMGNHHPNMGGGLRNMIGNGGGMGAQVGHDAFGNWGYLNAHTLRPSPY